MQKSKNEIKKPHKILCVCHHGNVRSVTMAFEFKKLGFDALSCGVQKNDSDTMKMLCEWADHILLTSQVIYQYMPKGYDEKTSFINIDIDKWGQPGVPYLKRLVREEINTFLSRRGWS